MIAREVGRGGGAGRNKVHEGTSIMESASEALQPWDVAPRHTYQHMGREGHESKIKGRNDESKKA